MKTYSRAEVQSLIAHLREGRVAFTHDVGHELPEILAYLSQFQPVEEQTEIMLKP
jgi:hypothetical protein